MIEPRDDSLTAVLPTLVKLGALTWWRTTEAAADASVRGGRRVVQAARRGENPADLIQELNTNLRDTARRVLGVDGAHGETPREQQNGGEPTLRDRGAELLRRSADVTYDEKYHPAYERMLSEIAPDEARVLRRLAQEGPAAAVDVRTGGPLAVMSSQLVAPGLTMLGAESGIRHPDRLHAYLNNLSRLGVVWFSREALPDQAPYQVLEAQPEVVKGMKEAGRASRTVRRSIQLTPFGIDFCETCLPLHTAEIDQLPQSPQQGPSAQVGPDDR
ncbi:MAG: DUF4393 domain-containing protein [Thermoleophilaceae bacterium]|nr:DUF4393 domain-containing protein [Thermoleophilaceae bacterium]